MTQDTEFGNNWENFIKMVLQQLDIPSREQIDDLHARLDKLEQLLYQQQPGAERKKRKPKTSRPRSATAIVLDIIADHPKGIQFKTIKTATGFEDKKLRNIIYRLDRMGEIHRLRRGVYQKNNRNQP
jgi:predicted Rossmann fold nucleotide-binding protein DprA/Smf involved in DNA uptake